MSLLTTSQRPTTLLTRTSTTSKSHMTTNAKTTTLDLVTPALNTTLIIATTLRSIISTLGIIALFQITTTFQYTLFFTKTFLTHARCVIVMSGKQGVRVLRDGWKRTEKMRQRLFFEFMVFILGCGNGILLFVFWPGWILVGLGLVCAWICR